VPVVAFVLEWPDGVRQRCTSPSSVVARHLQPGERLEVGELVARTREALQAASDRVLEVRGFRCTAADEQQRAIEQAAARYPGGEVTVVAVGGTVVRAA
jgi:uncharacterized repeat protein (TIGR04042 family)